MLLLYQLEPPCVSTFHPEEVMAAEQMQELKEKTVVALTLAKAAWNEAGLRSATTNNNGEQVSIAILAAEIFKKL